MCRHTVSTILAIVIAICGTGLPQFVHMLTAHTGPAGDAITCHVEAAPGTPCCHHGSDHAPNGDERDSQPTGPGHDHDCPICHFLSSTLATALLPTPATSLLVLPHRPVIAAPTARPLAAPCIPGLSQRGPPALI